MLDDNRYQGLNATVALWLSKVGQPTAFAMLYCIPCRFGAGLSASLRELHLSSTNQFSSFMKRTIISLLALSGIAMGSVEGDWTSTFTTKDQTINQTAADYEALFTDGAPLTLTFNSLVITGKQNGTYGSGTTSVGSVNADAIRPNANICFNPSDGSTDTSATYTLNFTLTNSSDEYLRIEAITLNAFGYNSSGNAHENNNGPKADFTLSYEAPYLSDEVSLEQTGDVFSTVDVKFAMSSDQYIRLGAGESITMNLVVSKNSGLGGFVGLSGATFKVVPEPATATLSLLALCGLAARRRRK